MQPSGVGGVEGAPSSGTLDSEVPPSLGGGAPLDPPLLLVLPEPGPTAPLSALDEEHAAITRTRAILDAT
jgi:hypothetical protein